MQTRVLKVGGDPMHDAGVLRAAELLRQGQVVAFPTETVYGLGGDATSAAAVERIFQAKRRPADNPLIVHVAEKEQLEDLIGKSGQRAAARAGRLADAFWPGPLTLVVPAREDIRRSCCRGLATVAVRLPDHEVARALIRRAGRPLAAPSANLSGRPSPTTAAHVVHDLSGRIPLILDAGPCQVGLESTVLDISGPQVSLLRPGEVSASQIAQVLGEPVTSSGQSERSPGTRYRHYRPRAPLFLIPREMTDREAVQAAERLLLEQIGSWPADQQERATVESSRRPSARPEGSARASDSSRQDTPLLIAFGYWGDRDGLRRHPQVRVQPRRPSSQERARNLYADLRALDAADPVFILADEPPQEDPLQAPLRDRLTRAARSRLASG